MSGSKVNLGVNSKRNSIPIVSANNWREIMSMEQLVTIFADRWNIFCICYWWQTLIKTVVYFFSLLNVYENLVEFVCLECLDQYCTQHTVCGWTNFLHVLIRCSTFIVLYLHIIRNVDRGNVTVMVTYACLSTCDTHLFLLLMAYVLKFEERCCSTPCSALLHLHNCNYITLECSGTG